MKRSEMIDVINKILYETKDHELDLESENPWAEKILAGIEDTGILPPTHFEYQGPQTEAPASTDPWKRLNTWETE